VYRKLGERDRYFQMLLRAVEMKSTDPGIYSNIGVEYANRGDTDRAISFNERAVAIDPRQEKAHANLGLLYVAKKNYPLALSHFKKSFELGMRDPIVVKYAGDLCFFLGDNLGAVAYYDIYLGMKPDDQKTRALRDRAYMARPPAPK
jgi:tetratricopeptide (TPR) repeat protein